MASAFNSQGATPVSSLLSGFRYGNLNPTLGTSPQAKALQSAVGNGLSKVGNFVSGALKPPAQSPASSTGNSFLSGYPYNNVSQFTSGLLGQSKPTTPAVPTPPTDAAVKSHTVNNVDGSSVTQTYHAPETQGKTSASSNAQPLQQQNTVSGSLANPNAQMQEINNGPTGTQATEQQNTPVSANSTQQNSGTPTYAGLVGSLANKSNQPSDQYTQASSKAQQYNDALSQSLANEGNDLTTNRLNPIPIGDQTGREAVIESNYLKQQQALGSGFTGASTLLGAANTQQGLEQTGTGAAAGLLSPGQAFAQVPYNSQLIGANGQPINGGNSGNLNDAVSNVVSQLQNSQIGYDDAKAQLAGYGQAGLNALSQWATQNKFNIAQSNTLAAQQGSITPNLNYANAALDNLASAMGNLQVWGQNSNIPILGGLANYFSSQTGIGKQQTSNKAGAVGEAQQAIAAVLASVKGGTPTDYSSQSKALLPDNPTPADIAAAKANLTALGAQKQSIYGNPGQQTNSSNSNAAPVTIPGISGSFVQDSSGKWVYKQ